MNQGLPQLALSQSLTVVADQDRQHKDLSGQSVFPVQKPGSAFMAQLLAARHSAAAFRQKRRASPHEAQSAYQTASVLVASAFVTPAPKRINIAA
jgi:hypothetical protein